MGRSPHCILAVAIFSVAALFTSAAEVEVRLDIDALMLVGPNGAQRASKVTDRFSLPRAAAHRPGVTTTGSKTVLYCRGLTTQHVLLRI